MNKFKYSLMFLGILLMIVTTILILVDVLSDTVGAGMFVYGMFLLGLGYACPTQLCEGVP